MESSLPTSVVFLILILLYKQALKQPSFERRFLGVFIQYYLFNKNRDTWLLFSGAFPNSTKAGKTIITKLIDTLLVDCCFIG